MSERTFCTFLLADCCFGVPVEVVQEIMYAQASTRVPLAPREIAGLIDLRGQIIAALELRTRIGLPPRPAGDRPMNVIIRLAEGAIGLVVDRIGDVVIVDDAQFEATPDTVSEPARSMLVGGYRLDDQLLLVLDLPRVVDIAPRSEAA